MQRYRLILIVALGLLCTVVYLPSLNGPFLQFDDELLIADNPLVRGSTQSLKEIWKGNTLDYYPLSLTTFWVEWHAGQGLPQVFRVVNLLLHLTAAGLFAYLLSLWNFKPVWLIVAIWALHPLSAATVGWISEQKNTLAAVFALGSCIFYTRGMLENDPSQSGAQRLRRGFDDLTQLDPRQSRWAPDWSLIVALFLFVLSLLAKAAFVPLPFVLAILIWWKYGRIPRREWLRLAPLVFIAALFAAVAIWFQTRHVAQIGNDAGPLLTRIVRAGWIPWFYLSKMIAPLRLSPIYERWIVDPRNPLHWIPPIGLIGVLLLLWRLHKRGALALLMAGLLLLGPILGLANLSFFRLSYVADHWTYPALMVFAIAVSYAITRVPSRAQFPIAVTLLLVLLPLTWQRASKYHDTLALWEDAARLRSSNYAVYNNLAWAYLDAGRVLDALDAATKATMLAPNEPDAHQTLAAVRLRAQSQNVMAPKEENRPK